MKYDTLDVTDERVKELAQVLANDKAMTILRLLHERELSISEISNELKMPMSTVSYHLDKLLRVGLVEVSGKKYGKRLQEVKLYRASSRPILLLPRPTKREKTSTFDRLRVITLSIATGLSLLVYWLFREHYTGSRTQTETIRVFSLSNETASRSYPSGSHIPIILAIVTFALVVSLGWFVKKRF
ncbi:transcriptional regulator [Thermococcus sp.]|uniref:ArsR/SmtB family transcription factor n=1 Tax=Thermococcus sp. TaxID=35749 RepID=UPI0025D9C4BC|nr:winged helix-turn-helix domain-containing protein [Thermococcus sp.]